jgi:hypothetical protein
MSDWICNRLPTEADADYNGYVIITTGSSSEEYVNWKRVTENDLWRYSKSYVPKWITSRQPTAADGSPSGAVRIRRWPDHDSSTLVHWTYVGYGVPWQPAKGVSLAESEYQAPISQPPEVKIPRTFVSITRIYKGSSFVLDAIASDGTAWCRVQNPDKEAHWQRLPDLP